MAPAYPGNWPLKHVLSYSYHFKWLSCTLFKMFCSLSVSHGYGTLITLQVASDNDKTMYDMHSKSDGSIKKQQKILTKLTMRKLQSTTRPNKLRG